MWKGKFVKTDVKKPKEAKKVPEKSDTPKKDIEKTPLNPTTKGEKLHESVDFFDKFYEENKDQIKMKDTYPINHEAVAEWQTALKKGPEIQQKLGRYVAIGLRHISFVEFYDTIIRGAYEAIALCAREKRKIILFIDGTFEKSNIWVALLVWPIVKPYVIFVDSGSNNMGWKPLSYTNDLLVLHVDDGVFSGQQVSSAIRKMKNLTRMNFTSDTIKWMVLVAVTSKFGVAWIKENLSTVLFPTTVIELESIGQVIEKTLKLKDGDWKEEYDNFFKEITDTRYSNLFYVVNGEKNIVYFDHKLPDAASTLIKVIAIAPAIDDSNGGKISTRSLIQRCVVDDYEFDGKKPDPKDFLMKYDEEKVCPTSFYKNIKYTFSGKEINKSDDKFNDLFYSMQPQPF